MRTIINVRSLCKLKDDVKCPNAVTTCETNIIYIQNMNNEHFSLLSFMLVDGWFVVSICLACSRYNRNLSSQPLYRTVYFDMAEARHQ